MICVPVQSCNEVMVWSACQSVDALCPGFLKQGPLQLPPGLVQVELPACHPHSWRYVMAAVMGPRTVYHFGLELVVGGCPGLFQGSHLLCGPGMDEAVDGSDVVYDDLVSGINVLFVMEIVGAVK